MNMELGRVGLPALINEKIDTLVLARQKLPGQRHNLDSLCRFYNVDNSGRTYHGALLDAQLLADVYVEMHGGLQASFGLEAVKQAVTINQTTVIATHLGGTRVVMASETEIATHRAFLEKHLPASRWLKSDAS